MGGFASVLTDRLSLTAVAAGDLTEFHALHSDPVLYRHAPEAMHPDEAHSASVMEGLGSDWAEHGLGYWSVRDRHTHRYLGCGGVRFSRVNYNVYYRLHASAWGHGYACEIVRAAAGCAYQLDPEAVLQAVMRPWNRASAAVAERIGMTFCGEQLDYQGVAELVYQGLAVDLR
jgi:RimJ/RimL family protein N-acetyltransferase